MYGPRALRTSFRSPTSIDRDAVKKNGFHDQNILVVDLDDPRLAWPDRELLRQIGFKLYGKPPSVRN